MLHRTRTNNLPKLEYPRLTFACVLAALRAVRQTYATLNLRPCLSSILTNQGTDYFTQNLGESWQGIQVGPTRNYFEITAPFGLGGNLAIVISS